MEMKHDEMRFITNKSAFLLNYEPIEWFLATLNGGSSLAGLRSIVGQVERCIFGQQ